MPGVGIRTLGAALARKLTPAPTLVDLLELPRLRAET